MSAQSQVAATLGQVARRLQGGGGDGGGGGEDRPLEGDLPDDGCILALADVATTRLYVVVEAVDGTLYLELSNTLTDEEFKRDAVRDEARLVFRRQVRVPPSLRARPPSRAASRSPAFRNNPTRRVERASRDGSPLASRRDSVASRAPDDASEPPARRSRSTADALRAGVLDRRDRTAGLFTGRWISTDARRESSRAI